jgi:carboxypeptidase C (cathepsin A)
MGNSGGRQPADSQWRRSERSDLVFIDAVGTGFSRIAGKGQGTNFWNVDGDVQAFAKFITRYVTLNHRRNSPKFLFGESYGTPRSAALVYELEEQGMEFKVLSANGYFDRSKPARQRDLSLLPLRAYGLFESRRAEGLSR